MHNRIFKINRFWYVLMCLYFYNTIYAQYSFGGYDFPNEEAFADAASEAGDPPAGAGLLPNGAPSVHDALTDINLNSWVIAGGNQALADIRFTDNVIVNESGDDFVVFEYGTSDTYGVAVSTTGTAAGLTAMIDYSGTQAIDLDDFGIAADATVSFIRIQPNKQPGPGTGEWSADIQEIGALHSSSDPADIPDAFDFDDGSDQGWTMEGIYAYETYPTIYTNPFTIEWDDATQYPGTAGSDPVGDNMGSLSVYASNFILPGNFYAGASYWLVDVVSPVVSSDLQWQNITGVTANIHAAGFSSGEASVQILLNATRHSDAQEVWLRELVGGQGVYHSLISGWKGINADKFGDLSGYTINHVRVRIFGDPSITGSMREVNIDDVTPIGGSTGTGLSGIVTIDMCGEGSNYIMISYDSYFAQAHQLTHARIDFTGVNVDIDSFLAFCCDGASSEITDIQKTSEDRVLEVDFSGFTPGKSICIDLDLDFQSSGSGTPYGSTYEGATVELTFTGLSGLCSMPLTGSFIETDTWTAKAAFSCDGISSPPPDPPSNLRVHVLTDQFHILWQDNSSDEEGFVLEHYTVQTYPLSWTTLATLNSNITSFQMDNPTLNMTHHFRVKAFNEHGSSAYSDEVSAQFLMSLSWISINAPNGGEVWAPGSIQEITWTTGTIFNPTEVNIWYSTDGGSNWIDPPVASNYNNTGSCLWTIPDTPSENCVLKIADAADGSPYDLSHDPFTIGVSTEPILSVSPLTLDFGTETEQLTFQIDNSGTGTLTWNVVENPDEPWITAVAPASGSGPATITVDADRSQLSGEQGGGLISVTSNGGDQDITVLIEKEAVVLPEEWTYTDNTGNNAVVILPTTADPNIDGSPIIPGDYIGVFTPAGLCCGWAEWQEQNVSITLWGDDSQTVEIDGFQAGETVSYRVFRPSDDTEWTSVTVAYSQGTGQYAADAILVLSQFDASEYTTISLELDQGWNMFSINVDPVDPDVETVLAPIVNELIIMKNSSGQTYIPDYDINHIGAFDFRQGYKGYLSQSVSLEISGQTVPPSTPIDLPEGWDMISYLPTLPMDVETALASIVDPLVIAKNGSGETYIPDYDINLIGDMMPGEGYQVYLDAATTLTYPDGVPGFPKLASVSGRSHHSIMEHFQFTHNTGENATVIITTDIQPGYSDGTLLADQDEIGAFTSGGLCCGAILWEDENTAVTVWGDDLQTTEKDGFQSGDTLYFKVYNHQTGCEYPAFVNYEEGDGPTYQTDGIYVLTEFIGQIPSDVHMDAINPIPDQFVLTQNYPNPFNPSTQIQIAIPEPCFVSLKIYDLLGREIETLIYEPKNPGFYSVEWFATDASSGVYLIRIEAGRFIRTQKVVLSK